MPNIKRTPPPASKGSLMHTKSKSDPDLPVAVEEAETNRNITSRKKRPRTCGSPSSPAGGSGDEHSQSHTDLHKLVLDLHTTLQTWRAELDCSIQKMGDNISININSQLSEIKSEIHSLRAENSKLKTQFGELTATVTELQSSAEFHANKQENMSVRLEEFTTKAKQCDINATTIESLQSKIDNLEQQARQSNLEICNIPEKRGENLLTVLESIGSAIGCTIPQRDILSIHRVPHARREDNRPKNIIAKLATRTLRDNVLGAFRLAKGVKTAQVGISGPPHPIYINEHLTIKKKQLFRECRDAAKRNGFKYVWVKHATILVCETENSPIFAVRSQADIIKIKRSSNDKRLNNGQSQD